jgi:hypothetical protein
MNVAFPPDRLPVPRIVAPSLNIAVPVAVDGVTVAVKVTEAPKVDGAELDVTIVDDPAALTLKPPELTLPWYMLPDTGTYVAIKV